MSHFVSAVDKQAEFAPEQFVFRAQNGPEFVCPRGVESAHEPKEVLGGGIGAVPKPAGAEVTHLRGCVGVHERATGFLRDLLEVSASGRGR